MHNLIPHVLNFDDYRDYSDLGYKTPQRRINWKRTARIMAAVTLPALLAWLLMPVIVWVLVLVLTLMVWAAMISTVVSVTFCALWAWVKLIQTERFRGQ